MPLLHGFVKKYMYKNGLKDKKSSSHIILVLNLGKHVNAHSLEKYIKPEYYNSWITFQHCQGLC